MKRLILFGELLCINETVSERLRYMKLLKTVDLLLKNKMSIEEIWSFYQRRKVIYTNIGIGLLLLFILMIYHVYQQEASDLVFMFRGLSICYLCALPLVKPERNYHNVWDEDLQGYKVKGQVSKRFWKSTEAIAALRSSMRPDIVLLHKDKKEVIVLDTKWKNLNEKGPSTDDLRQMYVYHEYFDASMVALVYPGEELKISGSYFKKDDNKELDNKHCHIVQIPADKDFVIWKKRIVERLINTIT
ncbi:MULTISPECIES: 5-methylcytosine restriction system specificity protein McrC [Sphingobacterium]|uniref:5-methylcytosine restriction system specificity protein McrC n=1 Tax=Sphingobacterium TaxID=28453 RepID=UPI0013DBA44F|nr:MULTISPECIES: hypothetical protein [unclassified Sphingobacterium]